jgi:hypothetical protein
VSRQRRRGLSLLYATVNNSTGPALNADGLTVGADVSLNKLAASGCGPYDVVRLVGGRIDPALLLAACHLHIGT